MAAGCTLLVVGMVQLSVASGLQTFLRRSWVCGSGAGTLWLLHGWVLADVLPVVSLELEGVAIVIARLADNR